MYKMEKSCAYFFVNQTPMISKSKYALKGHSKEVLMHYKKSMRIFWLSLCLLIAAGIILLAAIQYQSHKRLLEGSYENIKVTTPEDIPVAETFVRKREVHKYIKG